MDKELWARVPWSTQPSLKLKTDEVGIDFDRFIEALKNHRTDTEMARDFNVPVGVVSHLREHFFRFGLDSVFGQD